MKISEKVYMHISNTFIQKKSPLASKTASIKEQNFLQVQRTTSLAIWAITSEIFALIEARML